MFFNSKFTKIENNCPDLYFKVEGRGNKLFHPVFQSFFYPVHFFNIRNINQPIAGV